MKTIHKYTLEAYPSEYLIPKDAKFLSVQVQHGKPRMWFLVDPEAKLERRRFSGFGTGHEVSTEGLKDFLGTFQLDEGALVFHVFEYNY